MNIWNMLLGKLTSVDKAFERDALTSGTTNFPSLKRLLALEAGRALCYSVLLLVGTICTMASLHRSVDGSLVAALGIVAPSVALLAGVSYRKAESAPVLPGATLPSAPPSSGAGPIAAPDDAAGAS